MYVLASRITSMIRGYRYRKEKTSVIAIRTLLKNRFSCASSASGFSIIPKRNAATDILKIAQKSGKLMFRYSPCKASTFLGFLKKRKMRSVPVEKNPIIPVSTFIVRSARERNQSLAKSSKSRWGEYKPLAGGEGLNINTSGN